jgi:3-hydroxyisobutyrate dehydrogenase-like beta-hydroxyacid dehydrogenase
MTDRVALLGLGEVGRVFAEDLRAAGVGDVSAWDIAFDRPDSAASRDATDLGLRPASSATDAVAGAVLVVSAVTASSCVAAATAAAPALAAGAWFLDLNSSSPGHKREAAALVDGHGGRYVEAALMSPIGPRRLGSPFLLGGPHAKEFATLARAWALTDVTRVSDTVGRAAATKLCRSVVVKGLEALLTEALLAARTYGVERDVLDSLSNLLPAADWEAVAGYAIGRSVQHGTRRAEEMQEAAATLAEAGIEPLMASATARRQAWTGGFPQALPAYRDGGTLGLLDALLEETRPTGEPAAEIGARA